MYVELEVSNHPELKNISFWDEPFNNLSLAGICESDVDIDFDGQENTHDSWKFYFEGENAKSDALFCQEILENSLENLSSKIIDLEEINYNLSWRENFKEIPLTDSLTIAPWFDDEKMPTTQEKNILYIYPGLGFGTGQHPTTQLCLKLMEKHQKHLSCGNVLDFGSGSGILGIAALMKDRRNQDIVSLYDIDKDANENALTNIKLNSLLVQNKRFEVCSLMPDYCKMSYSTIIANILLLPLLELENNINQLADSNALIILSGILSTQKSELIEYYINKKWILIESDDLDQWSCVVFQKASAE